MTVPPSAMLAVEFRLQSTAAGTGSPARRHARLVVDVEVILTPPCTFRIENHE
jgi:hypothetical protein